MRGLESLGFTVKDRGSAGHKTYAHSGLRDWPGGSFNCGHGRNPEILSSYVGNILRVLERFLAELELLQPQP